MTRKDHNLCKADPQYTVCVQYGLLSFFAYSKFDLNLLNLRSVTSVVVFLQKKIFRELVKFMFLIKIYDMTWKYMFR